MNPAPRILLTTDAVGGVWTYTLNLAEGLAARGWSCVVAVLGPDLAPGQREAARSVPTLELIETGLPLDWLACDEADLARACAQLAAIARDNAAATIHLHALAFARGPWPVPVVAVAHSCVGTWWDTMRSGPMPGDLAWRVAATRAGVELADAVIAPSQAFADVLARVYGSVRHVDVVHNGLAPRPVAPFPRDRVVVTAGRLWDPAKNMATLDAAAALISAPIRAAGPLVGPGSECFVPRHLEPLGTLTSGGLHEVMSRAAIFASPACYEPFGLAVAEAAQLGTPLVLADIPTFRELWGDAAMLLPPHDISAWAVSLAALLDDPDRRMELGVRSAARAARYGRAAMVDRTLTVHRRVLNASRQAA